MNEHDWIWALGGTLALSLIALGQSAPPQPERGPESRPTRPLEEKARNADEFVVDLRSGAVTGAHQAISLVSRPGDHDRDGWKEAVLKVNLYGYRYLEVVAEFDGAPKDFALNIGDSRTNNGYAGDGATQTNDAELEVVKGTLRVWGNDNVPTPQRKLAEWNQAVDAGTRLSMRIGDGELRWQTSLRGQTASNQCLSSNLFALDGQEDREGPVNYDLYLGLNRVVSGGRYGSGLGRVRLRLVR